MKVKNFAIAIMTVCAVVILCFAMFAAPIRTATENYVTQEIKDATNAVYTAIGNASSNVVYIANTNLQAKINRINDKEKGVKWEALMVNGQLYYVATMPSDEE